MADRDIVLNGIHIGEHDFIPEKIIDEIKSRCIDKGFNYAVLRPHGEGITQEDYCKWARYLAENKIYFMLLYTIKNDCTNIKESKLTRETVQKIKETAGEYFMGDLLGEPGSYFTIKSEGYFVPEHPAKPLQNIKDMSEGEKNYIAYVSDYVRVDNELGIDDVACVDATMFSCYNIKSGVTIPILEVMIGNPEMLIAELRGAARAYGKKLWGTYIAQEWYGGKHHEDILKQKRLSLAYKYSYISGSNIFCLESGDEQLNSFGSFYDYDHEYCRLYREVLDEFNNFIKSDNRPCGGPKTKVAFVMGNNDGYGGGPQGSHVWGQLTDRRWGSGDAEHSWRILDDISKSTDWYCSENFGKNDFSGHIPYGMYDIIPADSDFDVMAKYEYLFFVGWNTMTEDIYTNLVRYVKNGGRLLMTAAHLNTNPKRNGETTVINNGNVEELFGCRITGEFISGDGIKFASKSIIPDVLYPGLADYNKDGGDPFYSFGYARYAKTLLCGGTASAILDDCFAPVTDKHDTAVVENKLGDGYAVLLTTLEYPGKDAVYTLYKTIVSILMCACHEQSDIKLYGSTKVKFAVYEGNVMYMLNTDFDSVCNAHVVYNNNETVYSLKPGELVRVEL